MVLRAHTFPARFSNIFVDYPMGQMRVDDNCGLNGIKFLCVVLVLVWCTSSTCGVSFAHLNYTAYSIQ